MLTLAHSVLLSMRSLSLLSMHGGGIPANYVCQLVCLINGAPNIWQGKTVKAYCWETIADLSKERSHDPSCTDLTSGVVHGIEFSKFNEASIKNKVSFLCFSVFMFQGNGVCWLPLIALTCDMKPLTVQEMFGRHLMQLPGLSADKAAVILEKYPTLQQ